jgi:electron transfer flavoprotein-quinone oxidoreductase
MTGGGFLYTNKESISLGVVVSMEQMRSRGDELESWQLLDEFRELPQIKPLVAGGTVAEYSAHAIPEGGIDCVPRLYGDGYLLAGDAAGLSLNALVTVRGMDFALASGFHAALALLAARAAGDTTAVGLAGYERRLRDSFVLRDLETFRGAPQLIENRRLFTEYPDAVARMLEDVFRVGPQGGQSLLRGGLRGARREFLKLDTLRDLWSLRKLW